MGESVKGILQWIDSNNLKCVVSYLPDSGKFIANIPHLEEVDGRMLRWIAGYGRTTEDAIKSMACNMSGKNLVHRADYHDRKHLQAPFVIVD